MKKTSLLVLLILFILPCFLSAGTTGKIAGIVKDAENDQSLPGVNVYLEGTTYGSATDENGSYYILNVQPGNYTMKVSYVGYAEYQVTNVSVKIDQTTTINVDLKSEIMMGETVTVIAERPVVTRDISNSQLNIEAKVIDMLPVQTINQVLTLQAGIQSGLRGVIIRGGSANQTVYMVDGLSQNDERANYPYSAVSLSATEEVQVQTGGFNAEYGQARSGIVNVITKEGSSARYTTTLAVRMSPPAPKYFGTSIYDKNSYFNRPYFDPAVMWVGTNNGSWDANTRKQYPFFEGWNSVAQKLLGDQDPANDVLTADGALRLFEFYRRRQGDIKKPDYIADFGFGGPVPFLSKPLGNLRFYFSYFREQEMFIFPLSRDSYTEQHGQLKLTADISPAMKLMFTALYGETYSVTPYDWTTTPTGYVLRDQEEIANLTNNSNTGSSIPWMPGYFSPTTIYRDIFNLKFTHTLSASTIYEVKFQYKYSKNRAYQTDSRDLTRRYEIVPGYFVDEAPYGYYGYGATGIASMHLGGWMNLGRDNSINSTTMLGADLTTQLDSKNQVKTGFEYTYNDININSSTYSPSMSTWTRAMIYRVFPYRLSFYAQDKLEFEGFIGNIGARIDYSDPNGEAFNLSPYDNYYRSGYGKTIEENAPTKAAKAQFKLSPRLGVSHPITENSKLYFNYGHYVQEPESSYRFRLQREASGLVTYVGNPDMSFEKTIAYELGYEQSILDMFLIKVAGYYKDISNQPGWIYYQDIKSQVQYWQMANNSYADIRGLEMTLYKRTGRWITGFINYTYDVRSSGYFGLLRYYQDPNQQRAYLRQNPYQSKPHPMPYARTNLDLHTPVNWGPLWLGMYPLSEWNLSILADWHTGSYETWNPRSIPGVVDDVHWKNWTNVDMRISKMVHLTRMIDVQLYMDITNVFNYKDMSEAGFSDSYDRLAYLESLHFSWETGDEKGNDRAGEYRPVGVKYDPLEPNPDNDPAMAKRNEKRKKDKSYIDMPNITSFTFLNPRNVIFGIKFNF